MLNEPCWITPEGVVRINERMVGQTGEPHRLLTPDLLESACAKPRNLWAYEGQRDAVVLACTLLFGLARNHPFLQGNKRTGFTAMIGFLGANGFKLLMYDDVKAAEAVLQVINGDVTEAAFCEALRRVLAPARPWR